MNNVKRVTTVKDAINQAEDSEVTVVLELEAKSKNDNLLFKFTKLDKGAYRKVFDSLLENPVDIHKALNKINFRSKLNESIYTLGHIKGKPLTKHFDNYNLYEVTCVDANIINKSSKLSTLFGE